MLNILFLYMKLLDMSKRIIVEMRDDELNVLNNKKFIKCISIKKDFVDCVNSHPREYNPTSNLPMQNKCSQLFWNWYSNCDKKK